MLRHVQSWLTGAESPLELQPLAADRLRDAVRAAWGMTERDLLALCCVRMARDLDVRLEPEPEDREPATALERAAVAYTEHFLLDPNAVRGDPDEELRRHLDLPELVNFVAALNALEGYLRACALLEVDADVFALAPPLGTAGRPAPTLPGPEPPLDDGVGRRNYRLLLTDERYRDVRAEFQRAAVLLSSVDEVTTEAARLRNAWFQDCHY